MGLGFRVLALARAHLGLTNYIMCVYIYIHIYIYGLHGRDMRGMGLWV